ncbi:MAG TPA: OmpA family protein, partial [Salinivirgaceae bacterium]|nr:OmpA family protein [Salinivirgaceae bacterium]
PHKAKIKVYDNETKERIKYAYSPDEFTGKYLMIFPPGRNYDIYIEADGFLPQLISVFIPEQKYFYELYQEVLLESIEIQNQRVGENLKVRNTFYDIYKTYLGDSLIVDVSDDDQKNYDHLLQLIGDIICQTDSIGLENLDKMVSTKHQNQYSSDKDYSALFDLIGEAIEKTDSLSLAILDHNTLYDEVVVSPTYYQEGDPSKSLTEQIYKSDTLLTVSPIKTDEQRIKVPKITDDDDSKLKFRNSKESDRRIVFKETIYFDVNDIAIASKFYSVIKSVADLMNNNSRLGVELHGYTDPQGAESYNLHLSERRAKSVLKHISGLGVDKSRAIVIPHGIDHSPTELKDIKDIFGLKRRVEINVFELTSYE